MARLNQGTFRSEGNFIIHEFEVVFEKDDDKPYEQVFELPNAKRAVAIFESYGEASIGVRQNDSTQTPVQIPEAEVRRSLFHLSDTGDIGVRIAGKAGDTVKAVIIILQRKIQDLIEYSRGFLTCWACKKLVRALLCWLLAAAGFPLPVLTDIVSETAANYLLRILENDRHEEILDEVLKVLGERLKDVLREALKDLISVAIKFLIGIIDPLGVIAHKVCQLIGACP